MECRTCRIPESSKHLKQAVPTLGENWSYFLLAQCFMMWSGVKQLMWTALMQKWRNRLVLERHKVYGFRCCTAECSVGCDAVLVGKNVATFLRGLLDHHPWKHQEVRTIRLITRVCSTWNLQDLQLTQWDCWRYKHSGMCHCVIGHIVPDVFKGHNTFVFTVEQSSSWSPWCRWWCAVLLHKYCVTFWTHCRSRCCDLPVQQHSITSQ